MANLSCTVKELSVSSVPAAFTAVRLSERKHILCLLPSVPAKLPLSQIDYVENSIAINKKPCSVQSSQLGRT